MEGGCQVAVAGNGIELGLRSEEKESICSAANVSGGDEGREFVVG